MIVHGEVIAAIDGRIKPHSRWLLLVTLSISLSLSTSRLFRPLTRFNVVWQSSAHGMA